MKYTVFATDAAGYRLHPEKSVKVDAYDPNDGLTDDDFNTVVEGLELSLDFDDFYIRNIGKRAVMLGADFKTVVAEFVRRDDALELAKAKAQNTFNFD